MRTSLYHYNAIMRRVYDGDTSFVDVDFGMNLWRHNMALRWYGIDTAEMRSKSIRERALAQSAKELVLAFAPLDSAVIIQSHKDERGRYGRLLGRVYVALDTDDWVCINDKLLGCKLAQPYTGRGQRMPWDEWYEQHSDIIDAARDLWTA